MGKRNGIELKEAIETIKEYINALGYYQQRELSALLPVLSAAEKWEVMDWMHESGFADDYSFGYVMEHMQDFIDAYEKEKGNG
jgi:hypothetical protein